MERITIALVLAVAFAGCVSGPTAVTETGTPPDATTQEDETMTASTNTTLAQYPAFVGDSAVIVVPGNRTAPINRSVTVLQMNLREEANATSTVVTHETFRPENQSGTVFVLAPNGRVPSSIDTEPPTPTDADELTATVSTAQNGSVVFFSGGRWGIRAGVDALVGRDWDPKNALGPRDSGSLNGTETTVTANVSTFEGEVINDTYGPLFGLVLVTDDSSYFLTSTPQSLERAVPVNATVRAYMTELRQKMPGSQGNETETVTGSALEIVSVEERG